MNSINPREVDVNEEQKIESPQKLSQKDTNPQMNKSHLQVPLTNMSHRLDIIGEASLEMGSSLANQSSFQSKNIIHDSVVSSNACDENQKEFKTANNSAQDIDN